jgi:hypothetical protein
LQFGMVRLLLDIESVDEALSRGWSIQPRHHLDCRGLACTIWSEEPKELPGWNRKTNVVDGSERTEFLCEISQLYHIPLKSKPLRHQGTKFFKVISEPSL